MKSFKIYFIGVFILISQCLLAQDRLCMLNGGVYDVKVISVDSSKIKLDIIKKGVSKTVTIDKEDVFSIKYAAGNEEIFYKQDSLSDDCYMTVAEMSDYVAGQRDAAKGYTSLGTTALSTLVGIGSPMASVLLMGNLFLAPIPIAAFIGVAGARWVKINRKNVSENKYLKSDTYVMGYDHTARGKRLQNALIGGGSGLLAGIASAIIISSIKK